MKTSQKLMIGATIFTTLLAGMLKDATSQVKTDGNLKASLHNHDIYSGGKFLEKLTVKRMLEYCIQKDVRIFAFTDGNNDSAYMALVNSPEKNLPEGYQLRNLGRVAVIYNKSNHDDKYYIIRGAELRGTKGHLIALGIDNVKELSDMISKPDYDNRDIVKKIHDDGGIVIVAHPFTQKFKVGNYEVDFGGCGRMELENMMTNKDDDYNADAIETCNGQNTDIKVLGMDVVNASACNSRAELYKKTKHCAGLPEADSRQGDDIDVCYYKVDRNMLNDNTSGTFMRSLLKSMMMTTNNSYYDSHSVEGTVTETDALKWMIKQKLGMR